MRPLDILLSFLMVSLWGFVFVFAKAGASHFSPFFMVFLRFIVTAACLVWFFPKPPLPLWQMLKLSLLFSIIHICTFIMAMSWGLDASLAGIIDPLTIAFTLMLGVLILKEKIDRKTMVGVTLAFVGAVSLFSAPNGMEHPWALCLMIISTFAFSVYSIQIKTLEAGNILGLLCWIAILSLPILILISVVFETNHLQQLQTAPPFAWLAILYLGVASSIIGHGLWGALIKRNAVHKVAPTLLLLPVISAAAGYYIFDEEITIEVIYAMCIMLVGVGIVLLRKPTVTKPDVGVG